MGADVLDSSVGGQFESMSMRRLLSIGEFSRITHLSVKTLRHYADEGLLEPAHVDAQTGYRRYAIEQLQTAQVIRRLRALEVSIPDVRTALGFSDIEARRAVLFRHLEERESALAHLEGIVSSLRALLSHNPDHATIAYRSVGPTPALAIRATLDHRDLLTWWHGATGELHATLRALRLRATGPLSGQYDGSLFADERGGASVYVPVEDITPRALVGRISSIEIPAAELAVLVHRGPHDDIDVAYATLARHVVTHEIGVEGSVRESYLQGPVDYPDPAEWLTELGWPIFRTAG